MKMSQIKDVPVRYTREGSTCIICCTHWEKESYPICTCTFYLNGLQLTLGTHTQEGYGSCLACVCVCVRVYGCLSVCTSLLTHIFDSVCVDYSVALDFYTCIIHVHAVYIRVDYIQLMIYNTWQCRYRPLRVMHFCPLIFKCNNVPVHNSLSKLIHIVIIHVHIRAST